MSPSNRSALGPSADNGYAALRLAVHGHRSKTSLFEKKDFQTASSEPIILIKEQWVIIDSWISCIAKTAHVEVMLDLNPKHVCNTSWNNNKVWELHTLNKIYSFFENLICSGNLYQMKCWPIPKCLQIHNEEANQNIFHHSRRDIQLAWREGLGPKVNHCSFSVLNGLLCKVPSKATCVGNFILLKLTVWRLGFNPCA